jgi:hypothetical protein
MALDGWAREGDSPSFGALCRELLWPIKGGAGLHAPQASPQPLVQSTYSLHMCLDKIVEGLEMEEPGRSRTCEICRSAVHIYTHVIHDERERDSYHRASKAACLGSHLQRGQIWLVCMSTWLREEPDGSGSHQIPAMRLPARSGQHLTIEAGRNAHELSVS